MATPNGSTIELVRPDGSRVDVTEAVQVAYDLVVGGPWLGSDLYSVEEIVPLGVLEEAAGFEGIVSGYIERRNREHRG